MYTLIKNIVKIILPSATLKNNERLFRKLVARRYRGNKHSCNLCGFGLKKFVELKSGDLLCPNCGSNGRARGLWLRLENKLTHKRVLHFSPPKSLKTKIEKEGKTEKYFATDFVGEFETENHIDIENIDLPDESFNVIICYHVLEHVENDGRALAELYRVCAVGGQCYVQTPFKEGEIYEDARIVSEGDRLKHFGQKDHLRVYSVEGLRGRMEEAGFDVVINNKRALQENDHGLKVTDTTLVGRK